MQVVKALCRFHPWHKPKTCFSSVWAQNSVRLWHKLCNSDISFIDATDSVSGKNCKIQPISVLQVILKK